MPVVPRFNGEFVVIVSGGGALTVNVDDIPVCPVPSFAVIVTKVAADEIVRLPLKLPLVKVTLEGVTVNDAAPVAAKGMVSPVFVLPREVASELSLLCFHDQSAVVLLSAVPVRWKESTLTAPGAPVPEVVPAPVHWLLKEIAWLFTVTPNCAVYAAVHPHMKMSRSVLVPSKTATQP